MNEIENRKLVLVVAGPEWAPVRHVANEWFAANLPRTDQQLQILTTSQDEDSPTGRVARWLARASQSTGSSPSIHIPGDPVHRDQASIGVTELLLDPDPFQVEQLYAFGIWTRFVARRDRLKMRVSPTLPEDIVSNATAFAPVMAVMVGEWIGQRLVVASTDLVAAEVVSRAIRSIAQSAGDVGLSPWQSPTVQAATERGAAVRKGGDFSLDVHICSPIAPNAKRELDEMLERAARLIDTDSIDH